MSDIIRRFAFVCALVVGLMWISAGAETVSEPSALPATREVAVLFSGNSQGFLEPCG